MRRVAGIDLGLVRNTTAFVAWEGTRTKMKLIDEHEWKPGNRVLKLGVVLPAIQMRAASLRARLIGHDQHYAQAVVEHFENVTPSIDLVRTPNAITEVYFKFRRALERDEVDLSKSSKKLREQLEAVAYHVSQAGNILIELPVLPDGSHCDLVAAGLAGYHAMLTGRGGLLGAGKRKGKLGLDRSPEEEADSNEEDFEEDDSE